MSLNLAFKRIDKIKTWESQIVEFPWKTKTEVSIAVMKAKTIPEKIEILKKDAPTRQMLNNAIVLLWDENLELVIG